MAKNDVRQFILSALADAKENNGCIDLDDLVDSGLKCGIRSDMTRRESERYYWMRNAEIFANKFGFYSVSRGVYVNYENADSSQLHDMIDNLDKDEKGYEKTIKMLFDELKKRDAEHVEHQMEINFSAKNIGDLYRERRTASEILASKLAKES